jgi:hypothetical protein
MMAGLCMCGCIYFVRIVLSSMPRGSKNHFVAIRC